MGEAGLRDLGDHLTLYLERVQAGEELTVTHRGRPVALPVPVDRLRRQSRPVHVTNTPDSSGSIVYGCVPSQTRSARDGTSGCHSSGSADPSAGTTSSRSALSWIAIAVPSGDGTVRTMS